MRYFLLVFLLIFIGHTSQNSVDFGLKYTAYDYSEYNDANTLLDTEKSDLSQIRGFYAALTFEGDKPQDTLELFYSNTMGQTRYVGSLLSSSAGYGSYVGSTQNTFTQMQITSRQMIAQENLLEWYSVLGFGSYNWERTLSASQNEIYRWSYLQAGLKLSQQIDTNMLAGLEIVYRYALDPQIDLIVPSLIPDTTLDLGTTSSWVISLPVTITDHDAPPIKITLEYEQTAIGKSNTKNSVYEPRSEQYNIHLYLGFSLDLERLLNPR